MSVVARAEPVEAVVARHPQVRRFSAWSRVTHAVLGVAVFGLVFTGMPLKYPGSFWARPLMTFWGGPHLAGLFHRGFALLFFAAAAMHLGALAVAAVRRRLPPLFGPDSIVPRRDDLRHLVQYFRFVRGRGSRPAFGRFTYWEKLDYLAEFWGLLVIGLSGLIMWFPENASRYLPGWIVNAALIFHSYEALLAMGFLFAIHFFNTHLRPEAFPLDEVIFTGLVPLDEVRQERPGWYSRLMSARTDQGVVLEEERRAPAATRLAGIVFLCLGIAMLLLVMSAAIQEVWRQIVTRIP